MPKSTLTTSSGRQPRLLRLPTRYIQSSSRVYLRTWRRGSSIIYWGGFRVMRLGRWISRGSIPWVSRFSPLLNSRWQFLCNEKEVATCLHFLAKDSSQCLQAITFRKINYEVATLGYSTNLQPANTQVYDLETPLKLMEKERNVLKLIDILWIWWP